MSSNALALCVRAAVIALTLCLFILLLSMLPSIGQDAIRAYPEYAYWSVPWTIFAWLCSAPLFVLFYFVWKVSGAIKREEVFSFKVAKWIKNAAYILFGDIAFFFFGNIALALTGRNHPYLMVVSIVLIILGIALALAAAVLSRYIAKAAILQEESDATV
ncbi:MAG: DUF2975 domain-containing protein [Clostridiales bacterium]|jgi:hypothetical protein|nr:DUF2975 domain-containing protein [Clostridiales bacterium]